MEAGLTYGFDHRNKRVSELSIEWVSEHSVRDDGSSLKERGRADTFRAIDDLHRSSSISDGAKMNQKI